MISVDKIIKSREKLISGLSLPPIRNKAEQEGGCGVVGFACSIPVRGRHIFEPSIQMHNRGNGKGGGIAAVGFDPEELNVSKEILDNDYLLQIAFLDINIRKEVEDTFISPFFDIHAQEQLNTIDDYRDVGLEVKPPDICRYFVRVKEDVLANFIKEHNLQDMDISRVEDEFVYQNTFKLNQKYYASLGEKKAFVLSHGRNMMILKIVGYAEQVVQYYQMEDFKAHVWIAHQRYPTKGRVWHPAGTHPFVGLDEALVHNGDFANYHSVTEYLMQRNIRPLFLTDTEVSILLFDLWNRVYGYPLEYIIEAMAPTTELDFDKLPEEKQKIYRYIQATHMHGSPDGPWFFIIARNNVYNNEFQLIGITDTSMLRPQVFALQEGAVKIGIIASEKQAIDAILHSLASEDNRFCLVADKYWNARGGSHTDGGAFIFTLKEGSNGNKELICTDKFGRVVTTPPGQKHADMSISIHTPAGADMIKEKIINYQTMELFEYIRDNIKEWDYNTFRWCCMELVNIGSQNDEYKTKIIEVLTLLNDRRYDTGDKKRSSILQILKESWHKLFSNTPDLAAQDNDKIYRFIDWHTQDKLRPPQGIEKVLIIDTHEFASEGDNCASHLIVKAYNMGWKNFIAYGYLGQRFCGCGLGPNTRGVRIDVYDSSGDYLASGIDGLEIYVHGNAQDQLAQIMKSGKLVVFGDVGQTFMYGAKGGEVYVLGNAAGRPLINAVGKPRVVINGTCLDFLAESFMAGDPLNGGGFVILNGIEFDEKGNVKEQPTPYPGSNLFSLASGGAIYVRDPHKRIVEAQLNGGEFSPLTQEDWQLILPYLEENERLFGISIEEDLLKVNGVKKKPEEVYRKVRAIKLKVLTELVDAED
jgi:glutamate synthase domain-containing protein 1/glutamate synthase domain-containing protein 3